MDKKKLGAFVGVVGVAGVVTATQFINMDRSKADYMTRNLVDEYSKKQEEQATVETPKTDYSEVVYNEANKVEYVLTTKTEEAPAEEASVEEKASEEAAAPESAEESVAEVSSESASSEEVAEAEKKVETVDIYVEPTKELAPAVEEDVVEPVEESTEESAEVAEEVTPEPFNGVVNTDTLNVRASDSLDAEVVKEFAKGDVVRGTLEGEWVHFEDENGKTLYVYAEHLDPVEEDKIAGLVTGDSTLPKEDAASTETPAESSSEVVAEASSETSEQSAEQPAESSAEKSEEQPVEKSEEKSEEQPVESSAEKSEEQPVEKSEEKSAEQPVESSAEKSEEQPVESSQPSEEGTTPAEPVEEARPIDPPGQESGEVVTKWVAEVLNIRKGPGTQYERVDVLAKGAEVTGTVVDGWFKLSDGRGYCSLKYLLDEKPAPAVEAQPAPETPANPTPEQPAQPVQGEEGEEFNGFTSKPTSNVRKGPGLNNDVIGTLPLNSPVKGTLLNGWVKFDFNGQTGYISYNVLSTEKTEQPEQPVTPNPTPGDSASIIGQIVDAAYAQLGKTYILGANDPDYGFDCSGLCYWLYLKYAGIELNRTSRTMFYNGYEVSRDNLQPGDLIFFSGWPGGYITHVALYVGDGEMIHAAAPGVGVIKGSMNTSYWRSVYVGARRILN